MAGRRCSSVFADACHNDGRDVVALIRWLIGVALKYSKSKALISHVETFLLVVPFSLLDSS